MPHFILTIVALVLCACAAFSLAAPPPLSHGRNALAGDDHSWLEATLAAAGLAVTRVSAAELCILDTPCLTTGCNPYGYLGSNSGFGFQTEAGPGCASAAGREAVEPAGCYGAFTTWSISSSSTDSRQNVGPLPTGGQLFLWLCSAGYGFGSDILRLEGDLQPVDYEGIVGRGFLLEGNRLVVLDGECDPVTSSNPLLVGQLTVTEPVAVGSTTWGSVKALYR